MLALGLLSPGRRAYPNTALQVDFARTPNGASQITAQYGGKISLGLAGPIPADDGTLVAGYVSHTNAAGINTGFAGHGAYTAMANTSSVSFINGGSILTEQLSPDGLNTAFGYYENNANTTHTFFYYSVKFIANQPMIFSVVLKKAGRRYIQLAFGTSLKPTANFDLQNGTITYSSNCTGFMRSLGDGWYECSISFVSSMTGQDYIRVASISNPTATTVTNIVGINDISFYFWHPMVVQSAYPVPYATPGTSVPATSGSSANNGLYLAMSDKLNEAMRGKTDGVELCGDPTCDGGWWVVTGETTVSGGVARIYSSTGVYSALYRGAVVTAGQRYLISYDVLSKSVVGAGLSDENSTLMPIALGRNTHEFVPTGNSVTIKRADGATDITIDNISIQKLQPAQFTCAAIIWHRGAGSAELPNPTYLNTITVKDAVSGPLYSAQTGGAAFISYDGSATAAIVQSWSRDTFTLQLVQSTDNGTKFRVGYQRFNADCTPIDADFVWQATPSNFDGSFNPTGVLRWLYGITVPTDIRWTFIGTKGSDYFTDARIKSRLPAEFRS